MADRRPIRVQRAPALSRPKPLRRAEPGRVAQPAPVDIASTRPATSPSPLRVLEEAEAVCERLTDGFYRLGELYVVLERKDVYTALGFGSFSELIAERKLTGRTTAFKLIAIVKSFPRERALELGRSRAYALLRLEQAGGAIEGEASVRTIDEAARVLREAQGKRRGRRPAPVAVRNRARRIRASLRRRGATHVRVRVLFASSGQVWYRVEVPEPEAHVLEAA